MINYKQCLIFMLSVVAFNGAYGMEKKKSTVSVIAKEDAFVQKRINTLTQKIQIDSLIMQRGKTILENETYNSNPILVIAYANFFGEFKIYKKGKQTSYDSFVAEKALGSGLYNNGMEYIGKWLDGKFDCAWEKAKKDVQTIDDLEKAKKEFYDNFGFASKIKSRSEKETRKTGMALHKEWMHKREFASTKFFVETICKQLGIVEEGIIEQEKEKIIGLLKLYDDK